MLEQYKMKRLKTRSVLNEVFYCSYIIRNIQKFHAVGEHMLMALSGILVKS